MKLINARFLTGELVTIEIRDGMIENVEAQIRREVSNNPITLDKYVAGSTRSDTIDCAGELLVPAGIDPHVHSRDPGYTHKEDWSTLTAGAYKGGVVAVCDMPNTFPPTMGPDDVRAKAKLAEAAGIEFKFYLGVGKANIESLQAVLDDKTLPLCGIKVYYGQSTGELMYDDLERLHQVLRPNYSGVLSFHSEDQCSIDCSAASHNTADVDFRHPKAFAVHSEIRSSASAWKSTEAILAWGLRHNRRIHIAHISTPREVEMIVCARKDGLRVTTEVAPHHLLYSTEDYERLGPLLKMNPPVRSPDERKRLLAQFGAGEIDYFATDHAPHTLEEKRAPYAKCPSGVPGVEYFWPLLLELSGRAGLNPDKVLAMACGDSAKAFGFHNLGAIAPGRDASLVWVQRIPNDIHNEQTLSKCGWTPYDGLSLFYKVGATWHKGIRVYSW